MGTTNESLNFNITIFNISSCTKWSQIFAKESILNSTNLCQRHQNVTNVSLLVPYLYTGILIFVHLVGKSLQTSKVIELAVR